MSVKFARLDALQEGEELVYVGGGGWQNADIPDFTKGKVYRVHYDVSGSWRHDGRWCVHDNAGRRNYLSVYERNGGLWGWAQSS